MGRRKFAEQLDIVGILKTLPECSAKLISSLKDAIIELYRSVNIRDFLADDKTALLSLKNGIEQLITDDKVNDKIKKLQLEWFFGKLEEIIYRLN